MSHFLSSDSPYTLPLSFRGTLVGFLLTMEGMHDISPPAPHGIP